MKGHKDGYPKVEVIDPHQSENKLHESILIRETMTKEEFKKRFKSSVGEVDHGEDANNG